MVLNKFQQKSSASPVSSPVSESMTDSSMTSPQQHLINTNNLIARYLLLANPGLMQHKGWMCKKSRKKDEIL